MRVALLLGMTATQTKAVSEWLSVRGLVALPESSYGEHVGYIMVPVAGRKTRVRRAVTLVSLRAYFARI